MVEVSILLPALTQSSTDPATVAATCSQAFGVPSEMIELFALVPIEEVRSPWTHVVARIRPCSLSLQTIEELLAQKDQLTDQLQRAREGLAAFSEQVERGRQAGGKISAEKYQRRGLKLKQLDEDNKKLRQLLKSQLENSENLRVETQQTVETLRQEFDLLVKELMTFRKKDSQPTPSESKARRPKP